MGEPDRCIFCDNDLEEWEYEYYTENGNRGVEDMNICKRCISKISKAIKEAGE